MSAKAALGGAQIIHSFFHEIRGRSARRELKRDYDAIIYAEDELVAFGQIQLRKIDGHRHVSELLTPAVATAA